MLNLTEIVYLAAPFERPEERAFNVRLAELIRAYNFPLFMPQEALEEIEAETQPPVQAMAGQNGATMTAHKPKRPEAIDARLTEVCTEMLTKANLVVAVYYGEEFDPLTAFEVGYALGRRTNVVAVQNNLCPELIRNGSIHRPASPVICSRIVVAPQEDERFPDRLIPILNRYFVPNGIPFQA